MERNIQTRGIVTSVRDFGEMHRSITILTPLDGLLNVIIYGGRKGKNASLAPLFSMGTYQIYHDTVKDQYSLKEEQSEFTATKINLDLTSVYTASYLCEVVNCIKTDETSEVYALLKQALEELEQNTEKHRKILIDFTWKLLQISGLGSDLLTCPSCDSEYQDTEVLHFSTSLITPVCQKCADNHQIELTPGARKYLRYTQQMTFEEALKIELFDTAQSRISIFLLKWITVFCGRTLYTVQSGLL